MNRFLMYWSKLYSQQTPAEESIEPALAALGLRYRFQHPFWGLHIIADFILPDHKIVIEVDDKSHRTKKKQEADADRTAKLKKKGWTVVRCTNEQALANPDEAVKTMLVRLLPELFPLEDIKETA